MPLFECSGCHAVENTATTSKSWWERSNGRPMFCSECADGKWHGLFPKRLVSETNYVTDAQGFLMPPGGWPGVDEKRTVCPSCAGQGCEAAEQDDGRLLRGPACERCGGRGTISTQADGGAEQ